MSPNVQTGTRFLIDIEGKEYPWDRNSISVPEIRALAGFLADQVIILEAPDGTERTLGENEVVELRPGHRYGRVTKYRRGKGAGLRGLDYPEACDDVPPQ